jgi:hypothetical protein
MLKCQSTAVHFLGKFQFVVWDGDTLGADSFTRILPTVAEHYPKVQFMAYRADQGSNVNDLIASFSKHPLFLKRLTIYKVGANLAGNERYTELGGLAFESTRADAVLTFGGGKTLEAEYKAAGGAQRWSVIPVYRWVTNKATNDVTADTSSMCQYIGKKSNIACITPMSPDGLCAGVEPAMCGPQKAFLT